MNNLFDLSTLKNMKGEVIETLLTAGDLRIERIVTLTPYSGPGEWYDQELDEWVILLRGSAVLEYKTGELEELGPGDYIFIPAHKIHRVSQSLPDEPCVWLAVHGKLK